MTICHSRHMNLAVLVWLKLPTTNKQANIQTNIWYIVRDRNMEDVKILILVQINIILKSRTNNKKKMIKINEYS